MSTDTATPRYDHYNCDDDPGAVAAVLADLTDHVAMIAEHLANLRKYGIKVWPEE